jgi:hypothetical protein
MFSLAQIALSAVIGLVLSLIVLVLYGRWRRSSARTWPEVALLSLVVGLSILLGRAAGNTPALNDDPIPVVSPNDVLCPLLTYVCLGLYVGFHRGAERPDWPLVRALLTLVSFVVNVVTI